MNYRQLTLLTFSFAACGDTGREHVKVPLTAVGVEPHSVVIGNATVALTRAEVAFGPAYFCASEAGRAELCEVSLAELREAAVVNALDPAPQALGTLNAITGEVRSALYDEGISWLLTQASPMPRPTAPDGHSAVLTGDIIRAGRTLHFSVAIDLTPKAAGDATVNAQRTHAQITGATRLELSVDPHLWIDRLDVDALFALDTDADGMVVIPADVPSYDSIVLGMLSRAPFGFNWSTP